MKSNIENSVRFGSRFGASAKTKAKAKCFSVLGFAVAETPRIQQSMEWHDDHS